MTEKALRGAASRLTGNRLGVMLRVTGNRKAVRQGRAGFARVQLDGYLLNDSHRRLLRRFWLLQHLRTEAASRRAVEMSAGVEKAIGSGVEAFRPTIREAVHEAMRTFVEAMDVVDDLKICLIRNRTSLPFVSSDDPAIITNRWHINDRRTIGRSPGLQSAGALLLLPLSARVLCLFYDGDVYSVAHTGGWAEVKRERDIQAFNEHQFLNCRANIYFRDWDHRQRIQDDFDAVASLRPAARHRIHYAIFDRTAEGADVFRVVDRGAAGDHDRALIHTETVLAKPSSWPTLIAWRVKGAAYTNGTGVGYVRGAVIHRLRSSGFQKVPIR